jgi:uncharacterized membrane protein YphA (DoxX/SURF4 family)
MNLSDPVPANLEERAIERLRLEPLDEQITKWLSIHAVPLLRVSLGVVFVWFGGLKLLPGASPAANLVGDTLSAMSFGLMPPSVSLPLIGAWEVAIGLGLLSGRFLRLTLLLLALQMFGTLTPLVLFPDRTFQFAPFVPTLEGQYILKNAVLVTGAMVVGSTVRHRAE